MDATFEQFVRQELQEVKQDLRGVKQDIHKLEEGQHKLEEGQRKLEQAIAAAQIKTTQWVVGYFHRRDRGSRLDLRRGHLVSHARQIGGRAHQTQAIDKPVDFLERILERGTSWLAWNVTRCMVLAVIMVLLWLTLIASGIEQFTSDMKEISK